MFQTANGIVNTSMSCMRMLFYQVGGRFSSRVVAGQTLQRHGLFLHVATWQLGEHPRLNKWETTTECCSENVVPIVAITPLIRAPAHEDRPFCRVKITFATLKVPVMHVATPGESP